MCPVECPNKYKPSAARMADINNTPCGDNRCTTGSAKPRPITITPVSSVNNKIALSVTFFSNTSIHCPVNNSVMAVPNISISITMNNGFNNDLYILEVLIPLATRSVTGNISLKNKNQYKIVGMNIIPTSTRQL